MERFQPTAITPEGTPKTADGADELHQEIRTLVEEGAITPRAKLLLEQLAARHGEADVALLDRLANGAEVNSELRNQAVGLLLGLGYPHALRVSPEALEAYRTTRPVPIVSLSVLVLYFIVELFLLTRIQDPRDELLAIAGTAHLSTWSVAVLGVLLLDPGSPWSRACRVLAWMMWLLPLLGVLAVAAMFHNADSLMIWICGLGAALLAPGIAAVARITRFRRRPSS